MFLLEFLRGSGMLPCDVERWINDCSHLIQQDTETFSTSRHVISKIAYKTLTCLSNTWSLSHRSTVKSLGFLTYRWAINV